MERALNGKAEVEAPPPAGIVREGNEWFYQETRPGQGAVPGLGLEPEPGATPVRN
jgi:hypothetical protein